MSDEIPGPSKTPPPAVEPVNFPPLKNDNILKVCKGEKPDRVPVWIMRQAGRYLPEFRELRERHEFFEIVNNPELATRVTIQPINRFDLDAAIIFSDILVIPQALGMNVTMMSGVGPVIQSPLRHPNDATGRLNFDVDIATCLRTKGTLDAITLTRMKLDGKVPLIGFTGAPWTLLSYMIEGESSKTYSRAKQWLYKYPKETESLLNKIAEVCVRYLVAQVKAGAQLLQVFESHAEYLSPTLFSKYSLPMLSWIQTETVARLKAQGIAEVPMIVFAKGAHYALFDLSQTGYNVVGLDWTVLPEFGRRILRNTVIQGNLDPVALFGDRETIITMTKDMVNKFGHRLYICNLGHGIYPDTPIENVQLFIDTVHGIQIPHE